MEGYQNLSNLHLYPGQISNKIPHTVFPEKAVHH